MVEKSAKQRERDLDELLEEFNITRLRKTPSIALSGGERRRVEIARALATRPNYMLLDEPFAGIDPIAVGDIQTLVRHLTNRGIGVLITDHNVRETSCNKTFWRPSSIVANSESSRNRPSRRRESASPASSSTTRDNSP